MIEIKENSGFLGKFKASNISSNRSSLETLSSLIIDQIDESIKLTQDFLLIQKLKDCKKIIKRSEDSDLNTEDLIEEYIKFGEVFKSLLISHINEFKHSNIEKIVLNYLSIARYLNDNRVNDLAVFMAKQVEDI